MIWVSEIGLFVGSAHNSFGNASSAIQTSPDGISWTTRTTPLMSISTLSWSPTLSLLIAGSQSAGEYWTSSNGINWSAGTLIVGVSQITVLTWDSSLGLFAGWGGSTTAGNFVPFTSPDGSNWTLGPLYAFNNNGGVRSIISDGTRFFSAATITNIGGVIINDGVYYSLDGLNYTIITLPPYRTLSIGYSPDLNFGSVAVYTMIGSQGARFSNDGLNWNDGRVEINTNYLWFETLYLPELKCFVSLGPQLVTGSGSRGMAVSYNGIEWNQVNIPTNSFRYKVLAWSPELLRLVGMEVNLGNTIMYSTATFTNSISNFGTSISGARCLGNNAISMGNGSITARTNIVIGNNSSALTGEGIIIGNSSGSNSINTVSFGNVGIGNRVLADTDSATMNTAVGMDAMAHLISGMNNVSVGNKSMIGNLTGSNNVGIGVSALASINSGTENVAVGTESLMSINSSRNVAIGHRSGYLTITGNDNVSIGHSSLGGASSGIQNVAVGSNSLNSCLGNNCTALGHNSLSLSTVSENTAVGSFSMPIHLTGLHNSAYGFESMLISTTSSDNTAIGHSTLKAIIDANNNTSVGYRGLESSNGNSNTAIGSLAGLNITTGTNNILMGHNAGIGIINGGSNVVIGTNSNCTLANAQSNTVVGNNSTAQSNSNVLFGSDNRSGTGNLSTYIGTNIGNPTSSGISNIGIGGSHFGNLTSGESNICVGSSISLTSGQENIIIGNAIFGPSTGNFNTIIGSGASGSTSGSESEQIVIGAYSQATGNGAIAIGGGRATVADGRAYASADDCISIGRFVGPLRSTGINNISIGTGSMSGFHNTTTVVTASNNTAIGSESLRFVTAGIDNVCLGRATGNLITSGSGNVCIGADSGRNLNTGSNNTVVGVGSGIEVGFINLTNQSNHVVLGNNSVTNAIVKVPWTTTSDERDKVILSRNTPSLDLLEIIIPVKFQYNKSRNDPIGTGPMRYGFSAQNVLAAEKEIVGESIIIDESNPEALKYNEASMIPVLVNAIKELNARLKHAEATIAELTK